MEIKRGEKEGSKKKNYSLTSVADTRRLAAAETIVESSSAADETRALAAPGTATVPVLGSRLISSFFLLLLLLFFPLEEEEEEGEGEGEGESRSDSSSQ